MNANGEESRTRENPLELSSRLIAIPYYRDLRGIRFSKQLNVIVETSAFLFSSRDDVIQRASEYRVLNNLCLLFAKCAAAVPKVRLAIPFPPRGCIHSMIRAAEKVDDHASVTSLNILNTLRALIKLRELVVALDCSG